MSPIVRSLRSYRMKSGFSRRELAEIIGLFSEVQLGRHERTDVLPSLLAALSYQAFFNVPITELLSGLCETVALGVEERLNAFEEKLLSSTAKGAKANIIARKLEWLRERRQQTTLTPAHEEE